MIAGARKELPVGLWYQVRAAMEEDGINPAEWRAAARNVELGSAPCLIEFPPEPVEPYPGAFRASRMDMK
jgi:hypothetical protein